MESNTLWLKEMHFVFMCLLHTVSCVTTPPFAPRENSAAYVFSSDRTSLNTSVTTPTTNLDSDDGRRTIWQASTQENHVPLSTKHSRWTEDTTLSERATQNVPVADDNVKEQASLCTELDPTHILTENEAQLVWRSKNELFNAFWLIDLDPSHGLVLQFHDVHVHYAQGSVTDSFAVYTGCRPSPESVLGNIVGNAFVEPILVRHHRVLIEIETHHRLFDIGHEMFVLTEPPLTYFNLSYTAYPLEFLPPLMENNMYNCLAPFTIPAAFVCDVVQHCVHGEDERGCWFERLKCEEGWLPVDNVCVRLMYSSSAISASEAQERCKEDYGGLPMVWVQNAEDLKTLARFVSLYSNVSQIAIGLNKEERSAIGQNHLYRFLWHSGEIFTVTIFDKPLPTSPHLYRSCASLTLAPVVQIVPVDCYTALFHAYACSIDGTSTLSACQRQIPTVSRMPDREAYKQCANGSFVYKFHKCEPTEEGRSKPEANVGWSAANLPLFECENGNVVHYTLTVDGVNDCEDGSDETVNYMVALTNSFKCATIDQLIPARSQCDGRFDCFDGSDEVGCGWNTCSADTAFCLYIGCLPKAYSDRGLDVCQQWSTGQPGDLTPRSHTYMRPLKSSDLRVDLDGFGMANVSVLRSGEDCPETHFRCASGTCLPIYLRNNGKPDCQCFNDESFFSGQWTTCVGLYQCYRSNVCLHADFLCDSIYQCPMKDDERYCNITCPDNCACEGYAYTCNGYPQLSNLEYKFLRYLDLSGSLNISALQLTSMTYLKFLNASNCQLQRAMLVLNFNLKVLDLSSNLLTSLVDVKLLALHFLTDLYLSNNPLFSQQRDWSFTVWMALKNIGPFQFKYLELRNTSISYIGATAFANMKSMRELDVTGNGQSLEFEAVALQDLDRLQILATDDYHLCCLYFATHPLSSLQCTAPASELSSCDDLLKADAFRVILWTTSFLAVLGNAGVLLYRGLLETSNHFCSHRVLVINLCVSDLLMGVYTVIIGAADVAYRGLYLWKQREWKQSALCQAAGFLAIVSSEVSAMVICLITLDRLLLVRFPLSQHLHLQAKSTFLVCGLAWAAGLLVAAVPLWPEGWQFYSQSDICVPLPITRQSFPGQRYSFGVFIVFNFLLFVLIGLGQLAIFCSIHRSTKTLTRKGGVRQKQDGAIARRLFLVVFTDLCCWIPVGVMGMLTATGTPISEQVYVWVAVLLLPFNSMLNPLIYTLNTLLQRRHERLMRDRVSRLESELRMQVTSWSHDRARDVVRECLDSHLVDVPWVKDYLTKLEQQANSLSVQL